MNQDQLNHWGDVSEVLKNGTTIDHLESFPILKTLGEYGEKIFSVITYIVSFILGGIAQVITSVFTAFLNVIFTIFSGSYDVVCFTGKSIVDKFFNFLKFDSVLFSSNIVYFSLGLIVSVFVFKLLWNLIANIISSVFA